VKRPAKINHHVITQSSTLQQHRWPKWHVAKFRLLFGVLAAITIECSSAADEQSPTAIGDTARNEFFEQKIRPLLVRHCYECHSGASNEVKGSLRLDYRDAVLKGGDSGPILMAGSPDDSLLLSAIRHEGLEMPPGKKADGC